MPLKTTLKSVILSILAGFVAFGVLIAYVAVHNQNDLQRFVVVTAILYFLAGMLRGGNIAQNSFYEKADRCQGTLLGLLFVP